MDQRQEGEGEDIQTGNARQLYRHPLDRGYEGGGLAV